MKKFYQNTKLKHRPTMVYAKQVQAEQEGVEETEKKVEVVEEEIIPKKKASKKVKAVTTEEFETEKDKDLNE